MKTALFRLVDDDDRVMSTACIATTGGKMVDRSCRGRAAEADSTAVMHECTMQEDAISGIKKSFAKQKNRVEVRNLNGNESEFYEEEASSVSEDETFPNAWLTDESETVEMAALVPLRLREDMRDIFGTSTLFSHLILLENDPKAAKIEEET